MSDTKAVFYANFSCRMAANGGWILQHDGTNGQMTNIIGAFTTSADLLAHLGANVSERGLEEVLKPALWLKQGATA